MNRILLLRVDWTERDLSARFFEGADALERAKHERGMSEVSDPEYEYVLVEVDNEVLEAM